VPDELPHELLPLLGADDQTVCVLSLRGAGGALAGGSDDSRGAADGGGADSVRDS